MPTFAERLIAAHQAGVSDRRQAEQDQRDAELHKLNVKIKRNEADKAAIEQGLHQLQIQGMISGGPMTQPAVSGSDTIAPPQIAPEVPQNIADLITQIRSKPVQPIGQQQMPINPLPGPNIPVQLSTGMMTIPGNNLEMQREADARQARQAIQSKLATEVHPGSEYGLYTGTGQQIAPPAPKQAALPALIQEVRSVTPGYDAMPGPQKLKAISDYKKAIDTSPDAVDQQAMAAYLAANPGKTAYDYVLEKAKATRAPQVPQTVVIHTQDEQGNTVTKIVPKVAGATFAGAPTALEQNRGAQAAIVMREADRIMALIDKTPNAVGPVLGRLAQGQTVVGTVSPEAKALATALGSFEALQPVLHGFRGGSQTVDHFHAVLGDQSLNAAALKASLNQIKTLASDIKAGNAQGIETAPASSTGNWTVKVVK